jgi:hypothetical protein
MAMNHLANQAFYTWKVIDHHAHASQHGRKFIDSSQMLSMCIIISMYRVLIIQLRTHLRPRWSCYLPPHRLAIPGESSVQETSFA